MAEPVKLYPWRFVVLGVFMFINLTIQLLWICFAPITGQAAAYYGVSEMRVGVLAMVFMVVYIPLAIPASWVIDRFGIHKGVGLGAALLGVFGLARGFVVHDYNLVLLCTVGIAVAQPLLLNAITTVSARWFPLPVRATVAGLAMAANFIGTAIGLMATPGLVARYGFESTQMIYGVVTAVSALCFLLLARKAPPTPPGPAGPADKALMLDGLKFILRNRDFWFCMVIFFVGVGVFNGLATWIEDIVRPKGLNASQAGILGGMLLIGGIGGAFVIPTLSDRYRLRKNFILLGMAGSVPWLMVFTFAGSYFVLLAAIFLLGFFMMGLAPVGYQYGAEITYPIPEGTSNGLLMLASQVSVVFIFGMEAMKEWLGSFTPSLLAGVGLMLLNCFLIGMMKDSNLAAGIGGTAASDKH